MLVAICSVKGSPGATTLALALAARWPDAEAECIVVEADPAGGDLAARFGLATAPGLVSLAAASRRDDDPRLIWRHAQPLPGGLPAVVAPVGTEQARAALAALEDATVLSRAAKHSRAVVVVDCGRVAPGSPVLPLLSAADHVLVLVRPHAADLAHVMSRVPVISRLAGQAQLLLLGSGYGPSEVEREIGLPVLDEVPEDPRGAAGLTGAPVTHRPIRLSRPRLVQAAARIAATLAASGPITAHATVDDLAGRANNFDRSALAAQNGQPGRRS
ncbi:MinD/ParA family ATP-binding protein [Jiangella muralis]|uniref:MinD/ParA family ATP-binding protein n=1 Tax=Jiangella muralis TaxID=702383 RepID=UPI00069D627D|nr:hypothetical protein [Jiangella muralis]